MAIARKSLLYVVGIHPNKVGGIEIFARALAERLDRLGWDVVFCFESLPGGDAKSYLDLPNARFEALADQGRLSLEHSIAIARMILKYRPTVFCYSFNSILRLYPWIARLLGVGRIYFNDHSSRPLGWVPKHLPAWKQAIARAITFPITAVICVSDFVRRATTSYPIVDPRKLIVIYNGVPLPDDAGPDTGVGVERSTSVTQYQRRGQSSCR